MYKHGKGIINKEVRTIVLSISKVNVGGWGLSKEGGCDVGIFMPETYY